MYVVYRFIYIYIYILYIYAHFVEFVCVTHLQRCKTSDIVFDYAGGARDHCKSGTNKDTCLDL